ncbi:hypothetical protein AALC75_09010 [Lachnospiraceae bacterium 48-42]
MKNNILKMKIATVTKYKNKYFLTALKLNALFVYEQQSEKLSYLGAFKTEQKAPYCMYVRSFLYKDEIWFLPAEAEKIAVLNTTSMRMEYISIDFNKGFHIWGFKYNNFLKFNGHYVCLVPRGANEAVIVNMETKKVEKYYEISKQNEEFQNAVLIDNMLYFYPWKGQRKVSVNLELGEINDEEWVGDKRYGDAVYDKASEKIFHAPALESHILVDDIYGNILGKKNFDFLQKDDEYHAFYSSLYREKILFWGFKGIISIEPQEEKICYSKIREDSERKILVPIDLTENEAYVFGGNEIFQYDDIQNKYMSIEITIPFIEFMSQIKNQGKNFNDLYKYNKRGCEFENAPWTLDEYIEFLKGGLLSKHTSDSVRESCDSKWTKSFSSIFK